MPWTGSVALVRDGQVYVNRGTREGVHNGQVFLVGTEDVIRDLGSGEVLDRMVKEIAQLRVLDAREKLSICEVTAGDVNRLAKGMSVLVEW